jgi:hypothetical protein
MYKILKEHYESRIKYHNDHNLCSAIYKQANIKRGYLPNESIYSNKHTLNRTPFFPIIKGTQKVFFSPKQVFHNISTLLTE